MNEQDTKLIWESYEDISMARMQGDEHNPPDMEDSPGDFSDINSVFRVELNSGRSSPVIMNSEVEEDMRYLDGPNVGAVTTWMGEEYMYIKLNKPG